MEQKIVSNEGVVAKLSSSFIASGHNRADQNDFVYSLNSFEGQLLDCNIQ